MTIIDQLEKSALDFMAKRLPIENNIKNDIINQLLKSKIEIERYLLSLPNVNLSNIDIIMNDIRSILNKYFFEINVIMENSITNSLEEGVNQGNRFIFITKEPTEQVIYNENKSEYLAALLLYSKQLIQSFYDDLVSTINKNLYNSYIMYKDDLNGGLLNTNLTGNQLSNFTEETFDKFEKRITTITQTETNRALNTGVMLTLLSFRNNIERLQVKWVEVKDNRLCKYCKEAANGGIGADGVYEFNSVEPPPLHPNCRCILIPYLYRWIE